MRPPKTPVSTSQVANVPVYSLEQLHDFALKSAAYERYAIDIICSEVMSRCESRSNTMGYIIAEEIANRISEREE